ncbi:PREDICTED: peroxisomal membrane protein PMP22-like isoform X2 [Camelina sativa]|uniref:Peroxisomal membrane protein PMP22-like isoform X2 n=1 Tax=Camelina sativa TaxID=90675 RepID=A0ABM0UFR9_CAMSA|nr:PREDICTED: peroxisomal membrane protein PMP22-like isoform X2 [Camelina sativa]
MSDLAKDAWRKYLIQLQAHPLRTKAITAGVLAGCSDAIAQKISGVKRIQFRRLLLLMVLLEQLTSSPWNNFLFMSYYGLVVEGRPWKLVKQKVGKDFPTIQLTAWKFWPVVGWVNYQYVPLQFRVLFSSFVASCWSIFLNLKARSPAIKNA